MAWTALEMCIVKNRGMDDFGSFRSQARPLFKFDCMEGRNDILDIDYINGMYVVFNLLSRSTRITLHIYTLITSLPVTCPRSSARRTTVVVIAWTSSVVEKAIVVEINLLNALL
jgi:hypothetical protein